MKKRLLVLLIALISFPFAGVCAIISALLFFPCFIIYGEDECFEKSFKPFIWAISLPFEITGYEPFED